MKTSNTAITAVAVFTASVFMAGINSRADTITLAVAPTNHASGISSFHVATNVVAQIVSAYCVSDNARLSWINVAVDSAPATFAAVYPGSATGVVTNLPIVVGPATITLTATNMNNQGYSWLSFCTIQTTSSTSFSPSTAVVIPNDGAGPVTIILESSVDLVNWTPALPGTYGTTSSNRFFRVRAQR